MMMSPFPIPETQQCPDQACQPLSCDQLHVTKAPSAKCYKCKQNEAVIFGRVASCLPCLEMKVKTSIKKIWNDHVSGSSACVIVADHMGRWQLLLNTLRTLPPNRKRPAAFHIITDHDLAEGSSDYSIIDIRPTFQAVMNLVGIDSDSQSHLVKALRNRVICQAVSMLSGVPIVVQTGCEEDVAAAHMSKLVNGDIGLLHLHPSSSCCFLWTSYTDKEPVRCLMPLGKSSLMEVEAVVKPALEDQTASTGRLDTVMETFFKEIRLEFPSVASNVCRTVDKLQEGSLPCGAPVSLANSSSHNERGSELDDQTTTVPPSALSVCSLCCESGVSLNCTLCNRCRILPGDVPTLAKRIDRLLSPTK
eukprot:Protomagalhaensia_sp_Gyna_25__297@NODE_1139_length_2146_cov_11_613194_g904_i0_p1_GENE_NODE_1139_length_2146_cov_11_613194_g904_i0NODE_1139_length_2146_cov_11_613194_g904_i0_p1_ORF_typecomplete_len362_score42_26CTU2/PF10288_9/1_8e04CTU2/PF10288_9/4_1e05_NODE_1139_length_2146_cov_11_613194_g904_i010282113